MLALHLELCQRREIVRPVWRLLGASGDGQPVHFPSATECNSCYRVLQHCWPDCCCWPRGAAGTFNRFYLPSYDKKTTNPVFNINHVFKLCWAIYNCLNDQTDSFRFWCYIKDKNCGNVKSAMSVSCDTPEKIIRKKISHL